MLVLNAVAVTAFGFLYVAARFWPDLRSSEPQDRQIRIWQPIETPSVSTVQSASTPRRPSTAPAVGPVASDMTEIVPLSEVVTSDGNLTVFSVDSHRSGSTEPFAPTGGSAPSRHSSVSSINAFPPNDSPGLGQEPRTSSNMSIASTILPTSDDSPTVQSGEQTVSTRNLQAFIAQAPTASRARALPPYKSSTASSTGSDHSVPSRSSSDGPEVPSTAPRFRTPKKLIPGASKAIVGRMGAGSAPDLPPIKRLGSVRENILPGLRRNGNAGLNDPAHDAEDIGDAQQYRTAESFSNQSSRRSTSHKL